MIAIVDYGIGNLGSITKGLRRAGAFPVLTGDPTTLAAAKALVLPGDGAFGATMGEIRRRGLEGVILDAVTAGVPLLGICIGMQVLFEESEEHGRHRGLGLLPGRVVRIPGRLPVPHMGWNRVRRTRQHPILAGIQDGAHVYFVHSYYCDAADEHVLASTDYGIDLPAIVARRNVLGVQFHPEKSQGIGLKMIANWVAFVGAHVSSSNPGGDPCAGPASAAGGFS